MGEITLMRFSQNGLALLKRLEDFKPDVYHDSAGIPTIGYGTVVHADTPLHVTEEQASELLMQKVAVIEHALDTLVLINLTQSEYDALVIFMYNVGIGAFAQSTMLKKLNSNDIRGASMEFPRWCYSHGRMIAGLQNRRAAERKLFLEA